ncbi:phosphomannomutase [Halobacteroides halobius DSM 5150]|uniref:Phosphoglucomutase n=1 Tax=Halobacteroides halobius (strain ATCC 35273 / DSM 5150 / MD-1) TaxID=748449 RepID=L0K6Y0_HALHC|nr:phospho-sugar mutase [Halobacteroides halobius]AGB40129.1 phosphomannomutase [Halobacteroides halobius DSM 5150]
MNYKEKYEKWLENDYFDQETKEELEKISNDEEEIEERFYTDLDFGTGGMRGIIGAGTNRVNKYTIRKATQGLANYIAKEGDKSKGVAISHDNRHKSRQFATAAALVLAANGIKAYLFDDLRPTPELSYAVRELNTTAGIMVTASHNPPEYNGYKVYWNDGAQIVAPHDEGIISEVNAINDFSKVEIISKEEAKQAGLFEIIAPRMDDEYIETLKNLSLNEEIIKKVSNDFDIVYTPLHGAGNIPVQRILDELGFENVHVVAEQEEPDPDFSTVDYPNPEEPAVFDLAMDLAEEENADLIMANDPDADRVGIAVKDTSGEWNFLNGNQVGVLLSEYILENLASIPENGTIIKTIVTTEMINPIANKYNIDVMNTLTGFKYIGEKIKEFKAGKYDKKYIFGFEESYGYLYGTHARDKDAIVATMLIAEMAAYYESQGSSLYEELMRMYEEYGYYKADLEAIRMPGKEGQEKINAILADLRENSPTEINGEEVVVKKDYLARKSYDLESGAESKLDLPESNVLQFELADDSLVTVRPSGTEPKIKFYFSVTADSDEAAEEKLNAVKESVMNLVE